MNYANVFGRTQKQFDMTMNREKITVTDFFNSDTKYDVFFRRNQRSTTPQGKVRFFYAQSTPIDIGTIFVLNGSNFIVTSKDGIESKDDKGKVKKYRVDGKTKETIRYMIYDKEDFSFKIDDAICIRF